LTIAVVQKTLCALEKLAEYEEPLSLASLAAETGLPKPTTHRILQTLAEEGYVAQDETNRYYLTCKLDRLARNSRNRGVNLGVLEGTKVHYLHVIETSRPLRMMVQPNANDEYFFTAIGRAIVAFLPETEIEAILTSTTLRQVTPKTVGSRKKLEKILQETRRRGWGMDDEESVPGVVCLATPIFLDEYPIAGISITMPKTRATREVCQEIIQSLLSNRP
jgi:DNA-binding IclR family transcriptional regulator